MSAVLLSGCATTAPADFSYSEASSDALLLLVAPHASYATEHIYRGVDMDTKSFEPTLAKFRIGGLGGTPLIKNDADDGFSLAVKQVPAGAYVLVENSRPVFTGYSSGSAWNCYSHFVAVYDAKPGQITVIVADDPHLKLVVAKLGKDLSPLIEGARSEYPNLQGDIVFAREVDWITWPRRNGNIMETMNRNCAEPESFELAPLMAPPPAEPIQRAIH